MRVEFTRSNNNFRSSARPNRFVAVAATHAKTFWMPSKIEYEYGRWWVWDCLNLTHECDMFAWFLQGIRPTNFATKPYLRKLRILPPGQKDEPGRISIVTRRILPLLCARVVVTLLLRDGTAEFSNLIRNKREMNEREIDSYFRMLQHPRPDSRRRIEYQLAQTLICTNETNTLLKCKYLPLSNII